MMCAGFARRLRRCTRACSGVRHMKKLLAIVVVFMRSSHGVLLAHLVGSCGRLFATAHRYELASPHVRPPVLALTPYDSHCKNRPLCITAKLVVEWQGWVIRDRTGRRGATVYVRSAPKADMI